jgi:hypothetical protein
VNVPSNIPASASSVNPATDEPLDPLVESYRRLADVVHVVLSEQSLDELLARIARTVGELFPYDDITSPRWTLFPGRRRNRAEWSA